MNYSNIYVIEKGKIYLLNYFKNGDTIYIVIIISISIIYLTLVKYDVQGDVTKITHTNKSKLPEFTQNQS